jgi:hypothetical protein
VFKKVLCGFSSSFFGGSASDLQILRINIEANKLFQFTLPRSERGMANANERVQHHQL